MFEVKYTMGRGRQHYFSGSHGNERRSETCKTSHVIEVISIS